VIQTFFQTIFYWTGLDAGKYLQKCTCFQAIKTILRIENLKKESKSFAFDFHMQGGKTF
jgi:hypothetical protein